MSRRDLRSRLRWIALNAVLFLGAAWLAYSLEGLRAASPFLLMFLIGAGFVLLRRPSQSHP